MNGGTVSRPSPAAVAMELRQNGIQPVLLRARDKAPVYDEWQKHLLSENNIPTLFTITSNIGMQFGPVSGHLIDVEFDSDYMIAIAHLFMPPTRAVFGRASRRRSHWLYRCPALSDGLHAAVLSFRDGKGKELGSLRIGETGGAYSMAPGSIHPCGELVEWEPDCGPWPDDTDRGIEDRFRYQCVSAMLGEHWPSEAGGRDAMSMAVAGWLASRDVPVGWAEIIMQGILLISGDDEPRMRMRAITDSYKRFERERPTVGWTTLAKALDGKAAKALGAILRPPKSAFPDVTKEGYPKTTVPNVKAALGLMEVECGFDMFKMRHVVNGHNIDEFVGDLTDAALYRIRELIYENYRFDPPTTMVMDAVKMLSNHARFHPVRDFLDGLVWDERPRIEKWLTTYGGAEDNEYTRAVGELVLIAAVRRVRQPGCKFDELMIFEGEQGDNKSSALQVLAMQPDWFSDSINFGMSGREAIEQLAGKWIVEIPELHGLRRSEIDKRKSFLSRDTDRGRMAYAYTVTDSPRQCIMFGTTNDSNYLDDMTGNRRYWPVRIARFDVDALREDVEQLWAEAAHYEASGLEIRLEESLWPLAAVEQEQRLIDNPFTDLLDRTLREPGEHGELGLPMIGKIRSESLWEILGISPGQRNQKHFNDLGTAMKELGWEKHMLRVEGAKGRRAYHYIKGEQPWRTIGAEPKAMSDGMTIPPRAFYLDDPAY